MSSSDMNELMDRVPIVQSAVAGLVAYVASFVVVAIIVVGMEDVDDLVGSAGNILYGAHFVDSELSAAGTTRTNNVITDGSLEAPDLLYQAVPIVVLLVAGIALVRYLEIPDGTDAAIAGAAMAIGYVVLAIVGTFVFEISQGGADTSPELGLMTVLLMGIAYPVVFGGIGGYAGREIANR